MGSVAVVGMVPAENATLGSTCGMQTTTPGQPFPCMSRDHPQGLGHQHRLGACVVNKGFNDHHTT